jgi:outer membrane protein assembly factor BamB
MTARTVSRLVAFAIIAPLLGAAPSSAAEGWPHFGYDSVYSGRNPSEQHLSASSVGNLERRWGIGCDDGYFSVISRSPAVRAGTLYTSGAGSSLSAYDARTGELRWQFGEGNSGWAPQPVASSTGTVFYLEGSYPTRLFAVDGSSGTRLWEAPLSFDLGFSDEALVTVDEANGLAYLVETPFMPDAGKLFALDVESGEVVWYKSKATDGMGFKGDYVLLDGGRIYVVAVVEEDYFTADRVVAVDAASRQVVAEYPRPTDIELRDISKVTISGGRLLVTYCDRDDVFESLGILVAYDLATGAESWRLDPGTAITGRLASNPERGVVYVPTDPYLYALDLTTGAEVWRYQGYGAIFNPSLANGVVYFISDTNLYALDETTGQRVFRYPLGEQGYDTTQVAVADGMLFFSGNGGTCDLFALGLPGDPPADEPDGVIPAAASNPGAAGTFWATTMWAFQDAASQATLLLRAGNEARPAAEVQAVSVTVPRGEVVRVDDVLARFPEVAPPAAVFYTWQGVEASDGVVTSRTFTAAAGGAAGTLGQGIPGVDLAALPGGSTSQVVPLSPDETRMRSNVGLVNAGSASADLLLRLHDESGTVLVEAPLTLPGGSWRQLSRVFDVLGVAPVAHAYVEVEPAGGAGAPVFALYASLVDNGSGDPTYLAGQWASSTGGEILIPVAAHNPGVGGTQWVTDVATINWRGSADAACTFTLLAEGVSNYPSPAGSQTFSVGANANLYLADIVLGVFGEDDGKGAIFTDSAQSENRWSRTYNNDPQGTYGQDMPGLRTQEHRIAGGDRGELVGLEESASFRTNLGLASTSTESTTVTVELYSHAGVLLGTLVRTLQPRSMEQVSAPFAPYGEVRDGRARVTSDHGVVAYASVVDNATGDATTVLAKRIR